jgi:hypothetical protein
MSGDQRSDFHKEITFLRGEFVRNWLGDPESALDGAIRSDHRSSEGAFHFRVARSGAHYSRRVGLQIANLHRFSAFRRNTGHAFSDRNRRDLSHYDLGQTALSSKFEKTGPGQKVNGPGRTLEVVEELIQDGPKPVGLLAILQQLLCDASQNSIGPSAAQHRLMFHVIALSASVLRRTPPENHGFSEGLR